MFSHVVVGSNDLDRAKLFYDAVFGALGAAEATAAANGRLLYRHAGALFIVTMPRDGQPATCANGGTIGFSVDSPEDALAWFKAAVAHGGTAIEDPPGVRDMGESRLYLAYVRDPDGNKLCAVHRLP